MEHKREGLVMGVGAELFSLAGPVLVYGITSSVIVGIIAWRSYHAVSAVCSDRCCFLVEF